MVDSSAKLARLKEVNRVKVSHIKTSTVGRRAVVRILLNVEAKKANVSPILLLESKDSSCSVGEVVLHQTFVNKVFPHFRLHLHLLLSSKYDPYMDFLHSARHSLQEVLHSYFNEITQPCRRQIFGRESVSCLGISRSTVGAAEL